MTGLAWTEVGGELLTIESVALPGKGKTITTGKLAKSCRSQFRRLCRLSESAPNPWALRTISTRKVISIFTCQKVRFPKDGPSAGIGICTALVSVLTGIPVRCDVAMTGEITLRGEVLPIGGLKEKLLAAVRGGLGRVLIPEENVRDLAEIPDNIKNKLEIIPVKWIDQVLELALERLPQALPMPKHRPELVPE